MNQGKAPMLAVELVTDESVQGATPVDSLSDVDRRPTNVVVEPIIFMTRSELRQC